MYGLISRVELKAKLDRGDLVVLVDTLPEPAYRNGHLPGAISIPSDDMLAVAPKRIPDRDADIVVYCGNGPCKRSSLSADRLRQLGHRNVRDYHEGKADWIAAGLPVVEGASQTIEAGGIATQQAKAMGANRGPEAPNPGDDTPAIRDLAVIGDRRTAAVLDRLGNILWYCPERFDRPSLLAALLDPEGGAWRLELPGARPGDRRYIGESGVLETGLQTDAGAWLITDFMPLGHDVPGGMLCRLFSAPPGDAQVILRPRPEYAQRKVKLTHAGDAIVINGLFIDRTTAVLLFGAIFIPIFTQYAGFSQVHTAMIMIMALGIGHLTPPVGGTLLMTALVGQMSVMQIVRYIWPFIILEICITLAVILVPALSETLPRALGLGGL